VKLFRPDIYQRVKFHVGTAGAASLKKNFPLSQFPGCLRVPWGKPAAGGMKAAAVRPAGNAARNNRHDKLLNERATFFHSF